MFINELAEPQILVIYPGRFQPFHKGHFAVYNWLTGKFGRNNVYIATSNKTDNLKSPFTFAEKAYFMQLTGVPADRIVQATQPYQIDNVLQSGNITVADPANTVVIFAVSQKDMAEDPRFSFAAKKDGSAPYFQPLKDIKDTESMTKHGYIMTVPTFDFTVAGAPMQSGTELRKLYAGADEKNRQLIIKDLFGRYTAEAEQIMNAKIPAQKPITGLAPVAEDAGGVGVIANKKQSRDPRYSTSLTKDVRPGQIGKSLRAFNLAEDAEQLNIGDPVIISGDVTFKGATGEIADFGRDKRFVVVNLYNHGKHSFHSSDVSYNTYADDEEEFQEAEGTPEGLPHLTKELLTHIVDQVGTEGAHAIVKSLEWGDGAAEELLALILRDLKQDISQEEIDETIRKVGSQYRLYSGKGKNLGTFPTKAGAEKHEREVQYFKHANEGAVDDLAAQQAENISQDIAEIKHRINTERLPSLYVEALKKKIAQLEQERVNITLGR